MKKLVGFVSFATLIGGTIFALRNAEAERAEALQLQAVRLVCNGNNSCCQGTGSREYIYNVKLSGLQSVSKVEVGTEDGDINNYTNILKPATWSFTIVPVSPERPDNETCTPHGTVSFIGGSCPFILKFSGPAQSSNFTLGYDHTPNWDHHDADWRATGGFNAVWTAAVGTGDGPVHSPFQP